MYYDKNGKRFYEQLPQNYLGMSNFDMLSDKELEIHGFSLVTDDKPEYNPQTQILVQGEFDADKCVRHWVVQDIDFVAERKRKKQEMKAAAKRIIEEKYKDHEQRNSIAEGLAEYAEAMLAANPKAAESAYGKLSKVKKMVAEIKAIRTKSDEVEAILDSLTTIDAVNSIRLEDFFSDGAAPDNNSSSATISIK